MGAQLLTLKDCAKCVVGRDTLARAAAVFRHGLAVAEGEADKETLAHLVFAVRHVFEGLLLVVHFLVLGHVGLVGEVVKVAGISLRVQLGDKWRSCLAQGIPFHLGKVVVFVDILNIREAARAGVDTSRSGC